MWVCKKIVAGKSMKNGDHKAILLFTALLLWMGIIYFFSAQPVQQSDALSKGLLEIIHRVYESLYGKQAAENFLLNNHILRKTAHGLEYFILGILATMLMQKIRLKHYMLFCFGFSLLYAVSDEIHQSFVAGRGPRMSDVLLDTSGAVLGILIIWLLLIIRVKGRDK